ncbi:MAG: zinc ABC transporter substrate-binding protein [Rhodospirillaceae bacterium]|nr:zinc ABC transporter substrate-binding protein [Rhodospirillaceae bacterium]
MKRRPCELFVLIVFLFVLTIGVSGAQAAPKVVASILPIHSLVASVMDGVGKPTLLLKGNASPHTFSLKPSQARLLSQADAVFWVAHDIEAFLEKPMETLAKKGVSVELGGTKGLTLLKYREGGAWEEESHDNHKKGHDDKHAKHDGHDDHEKKHGDKHAKHDDHDDHAGHAHGEHDMHIWLDPQNARIITLAIAEKLKTIDPANAAIYEANAKRLAGRLNTLSEKLKTKLSPIKSAPFFVFHDAYQYLEKRYGLNGVGSITVSPERKPGAKRVRELRAKIKKSRVDCVFSEPQFEPAIVRSLVADSNAKSGVLDPLGFGIKPGPNGYFELMEKMANSLARCLAA